MTTPPPSTDPHRAPGEGDDVDAGVDATGPGAGPGTDDAAAEGADRVIEAEVVAEAVADEGEDGHRDPSSPGPSAAESSLSESVSADTPNGSGSLRDTVAAWVRDSHLLNRTGIGLMVAGLGVVTAVRPSATLWGIAALLALAGATIRFWSAGIISKNQELAISGPYAYVRNPLYTGSMLVAIAFLLLNGNLWFGIPAVVGAVVLYRRTITAEQATLRELFGDAYDRYCERVPALIPWRGYCGDRSENAGESGVIYSLEQSLHNKEFNGVMGALGMLVVFYVLSHGLSEMVFRTVGGVLVVAVLVVRGVRRVRAQRVPRHRE